MGVVIGFLRAVNLAGHNRVSIADLRALCESLGLQDPQTYVQSGNVLFRTKSRDLVTLRRRLETAMERSFSFPVKVMLRTTEELRGIVARNPFAGRPGLEPAKLVVSFLADAPAAQACENFLKIKVGPEELRVSRREAYIYYTNGQGRSKLSAALMERTLGIPGTIRNWNTVTKLLAMAEDLEG